MKTLRLFAIPALSLGFGLAAMPAATYAADAPKTAPASKPAVDPAAMQALQKMSAFLGTLTSFEAQSQASLDLVTQDGQRIQLDGTVNYKARRPDGFVISMDSDIKKRTFIYDGKQLTVYAPTLGYYASVPAPPTIRETLAVLESRFGISLPLADLFRWNDPASMKEHEDMTSGYEVGPAKIDGAETTQYAFREGDIDWQIWIQTGDQPLPRKVVIIDRTDPANPAYEARLSWTLNPTLTADDFAFHPPKDAKPIKLSQAGQ
jgi:hypothetical protein